MLLSSFGFSAEKEFITLSSYSKFVKKYKHQQYIDSYDEEASNNLLIKIAHTCPGAGTKLLERIKFDTVKSVDEGWIDYFDEIKYASKASVYLRCKYRNRRMGRSRRGSPGRSSRNQRGY